MRSVLLLLFLGTSTLIKADPAFTPACKDAYRCIWQFQFDKAKSILKNNPEGATNLVAPYLDNLSRFLLVFANEDPQQFATYKDAEDASLAAITNSSSPYYYFCKAEVYLQSGILKLKFKENLSAAWDINKAYGLLSSCVQNYPNFLPAKKDLLLLQAGVGTVPDNYRWMLKILGFSGNLKQAMAEYGQLVKDMRANKEYAFLLPETEIIHAYLSFYLLNQPDAAWDEMNDATADYATNPIACFARGNLALRLKKDDVVIKTLKKANNAVPEIPYLDYMLGLAKLQRGDKDAGFYLARYLKEYKGEHYVKDAYLKLGWAFLLRGDMKNYTNCMQLVSYYGSTHLEEDKSALRESQKKKMPSLPILQARLLFDGGYLDKALNEIHQQDVSALATDEDKQEYYYRQGRIYDAMNSYDKALDSYNTSTRYNIPGMYYAPASCLYSGMIWERRGNSNNARAFYKKCLSYTSYLYKDSFDQKAYAGLKRLE
jgi:hypothetical protein